MGERIAMHEQERRSLAAVHGDDARAGSLDLGADKIFEHPILGGGPVSNGPTKPCRGLGQCVTTMNSVARPVSPPRPLSEITSEEPGFRISLIRSIAS